MRLTIAQRQYFAFLALTLLVLLMTLGLANWNFESGFVAFMEAQEQQRLVDLGDDLLLEYASANERWKVVDRHVLNRLLSPRRPSLAARRGSAQGLGPQPRPKSGPQNRSKVGPSRPPGQPGFREGPPPGGLGRPGLRHNAPTALFDALGVFVAGAPGLDVASRHVVIPLVYAGSTVGELRSLPQQQFRSAEENSFVEQQRNTKWVIGGASLGVAAIIAFLLSNSIQRPIRRMTDSITDLSNGNYDSPLKTSRTDELGRLMNDLDRLSRTLGEAQTARRRWLADISHELRTPIAALTAEIEALKDGVRTFGPARLLSLDAQTTRLRRLVDDLYELSLSDVGGLRYSFEPVELVGQVRRVVTQVRDRTTSLEIDLIAPDPLSINADPLRIDQLLNNLLANAVAYTDTPGVISVSIKREDGRAILEIADTPPGVTEEECEHLFEPLYRREAARDRYRGGAGLGLAICKNIAIAHQANIHALPAVSGGLCIRIEFPLLRG